MKKILRLLVKIIYLTFTIPAFIFTVIADIFTFIVYYFINYCITTVYNFAFNKPFMSVKEFIKYMEDWPILTILLYKWVFNE